MLKKFVSLCALFFALPLLISCDFGNLTLTAQFNEIGTLVVGDRILFQKKHIGDVKKISRTDEGYYLVDLDIDADHKNQLTVYSIFFLDNDPDHPNRKAVFTEQSQPGGLLLADNSVVVGLDRPPLLWHMLEDLNETTKELVRELTEKMGLAQESYEAQSKELGRQLGEALAEIERNLKVLEQKLRTAPDSAEAQELKRKLQQLVDDLENSLNEAATIIGRDFLASLQQSLENLKHRLRELQRRKQASPPEEEPQDYDKVKV